MNKVHLFLKKEFSQKKAELLLRDGRWKNKGNENRFVLTIDDKIIGYCSFIPTKILINNKAIQAIWWVDLIIDSLERGKGYQTITDQYIRGLPEIKLGFPNKYASKIHFKHDWSIREDLKVLLCPLIPKKINKINSNSGFSKILSIIIPLLLNPVMVLIKFFNIRRKVKWSKKIIDPDPRLFYNLFLKNIGNNLITTWRDLSHFNWRYLSSIHKDELSFYITENQAGPTHYCITRTEIKRGNKVMRILDLYGDLRDKDRIKDILTLIVKDASKSGITQITSLVTLPEMLLVYFRCGFILRSTSRFCWYGNNLDIKNRFNGKIYWTLGDSDNDE
tara:strand:- start:4528 stop:5526 length:999 start_codon:yes stop_codon:yes gene_type:complete